MSSFESGIEEQVLCEVSEEEEEEEEAETIDAS